MLNFTTDYIGLKLKLLNLKKYCGQKVGVRLLADGQDAIYPLFFTEGLFDNKVEIKYEPPFEL